VRYFAYSLGHLSVLMLFGLFAPATSAEPPPRAPLDALWEEHMLLGSSASIYVDESGQRTVSIPRRAFDEQRGEQDVEGALATPYGIHVARLDERWLLWRNGGWVLQGGLLARVKEQSAAIELYGKAVIRRPPYVPGGPFPRDPPMTRGYEFFLLLRRTGVPRAIILRKWTVEPRDVVKDSPPRATLQYSATTNTATVTIVRARTPVLETVEIPR
jgi:hypothetical protein